MKRIAILAIAVIMCGIGWAAAQTPDTVAVRDNIVDAINAADGPVFIVQAQELDAVTAHSSVDTRSSRGMGYRLQVYSDNNVRTSKATAERISRELAEAVSSMPGVSVRVVFDSPWWRVYVGDFRSYSAADEALHRFKNILPAQARDMRVMRIKLNTSH